MKKRLCFVQKDGEEDRTSETKGEGKRGESYWP